MTKSKTKVLFIAGTGRSGSTLLDVLLGQIEGFFSMGELNYVFERSYINNQLCGCGVAFKACPFWREVTQQAYGNFSKVNPEHIANVQNELTKRRNIVRLLCHQPRSQSFSQYLREYTETYKRLLMAIQHVSGAGILVDSSKSPIHGLLLQTHPDIELYVIHLVRDSRAVAYSWQRKKRRPDLPQSEAYFPQFGTVRSARRWIIANVLTEILRKNTARYVMVRYEDFVRRPLDELSNVLSIFGMDPQSLPAIASDNSIELSANHTASGNPIRFTEKRIQLELDTEWKTELSRYHYLTVTCLTWPYLRKYGYTI